jgi:hypothetical protein
MSPPSSLHSSFIFKGFQVYILAWGQLCRCLMWFPSFLQANTWWHFKLSHSCFLPYPSQLFSNHSVMWQYVQWNVSITKSCGWRNYVHYNEILLHLNAFKNVRMIVYRVQKRKRTNLPCVFLKKSAIFFCAACFNRVLSVNCWTVLPLSNTVWNIFPGHSKETAMTEMVDVVMYGQFLFLNHFQSLWSSFLC